MLMAVKDFLAPTRGRMILFMLIFVSVFLYDTAFAPFPGSPVVENMGNQEGATSFLLYILILPYILSCLIPAFLGLRKRRFFRLSNLAEFMHARPEIHEQKPTKQQTFVFPTGTATQSSRMAPQTSPESLDEVESSQPQASGPKLAKTVARPKAAKRTASKKPAKRASTRKPAKSEARRIVAKKK